ncbi:MAG: hypothetical protein ABIN57_10470 [Chitinophagaceae bacterium]
MVREIKFRNNNITIATERIKTKKRTTEGRLHNQEFEIVSKLVIQKYQHKDAIDFEALFSIPMEDRIPELVKKFGKETVLGLMEMMLSDFIASLDLPKAKKMTQKKLSLLAFDLIQSTSEDFLSLEDVILFLTRARSGFYGEKKDMSTPALFVALLEQYRQERHEAFLKLKSGSEAKIIEHPMARMAPEPTSINELMNKAWVINISGQRMSG